MKSLEGPMVGENMFVFCDGNADENGDRMGHESAKRTIQGAYNASRSSERGDIADVSRCQSLSVPLSTVCSGERRGRLGEAMESGEAAT